MARPGHVAAHSISTRVRFGSDLSRVVVGQRGDGGRTADIYPVCNGRDVSANTGRADESRLRTRRGDGGTVISKRRLLEHIICAVKYADAVRFINDVCRGSCACKVVVSRDRVTTQGAESGGRNTAIRCGNSEARRVAWIGTFALEAVFVDVRDLLVGIVAI